MTHLRICGDRFEFGEFAVVACGTIAPDVGVNYDPRNTTCASCLVAFDDRQAKGTAELVKDTLSSDEEPRYYAQTIP